ncbi:energy transducer TonB [Telluria sp. B2]
MSYAASASPHANDVANRRMLAGLLLSLLVHAVILSIQFGVPGMLAGATGPIAVTLAPLPPQASGPVPPSPAAPPLPDASASPAPRMAAAPPLPPAPSSGFQLRDPVPLAPAPAPAKPPARQLAKRRRLLRRPAPPPLREALETPVIAQQDNPDAAFRLPLPGLAVESQEEPQSEPQLAAADQPAVEPTPPETAAQDEAEALAREQEDERERARLAAEEERRRVRAEEEQERLAAVRAEEERLVRERQREDERLRLAAEQQRVDEEGLRARALEARRRRAEEARLAELREAGERERIAAAQRQVDAQRELARQREEALARERQLALQREQEAAAHALAEQAARQRELEEEARRAEQIARRKLEQALEERQREADVARRQAEQAAQAERARQAALAGADRTGDAGLAPGPGKGAGGSAIPRGMLGSDLALRARELMRGIDIPADPPAALRPAQQAARPRRAMVASNERDVPLRMYVDSFRQKIERNAAQIQMRLSAIPARVDPIVSVAVRSDGSIDEVTILRSSGRADTDDAVRRIVHLNARYAAFPPNVAARFDVIEIRRIWTFAETLKLLEEVR